jgi:hypothetical protein
MKWNERTTERSERVKWSEGLNIKGGTRNGPTSLPFFTTFRNSFHRFSIPPSAINRIRDIIFLSGIIFLEGLE